MQLGNFAISLTVKDIAVSKEFYEKLGEHFAVLHSKTIDKSFYACNSPSEFFRKISDLAIGYGDTERVTFIPLGDSSCAIRMEGWKVSDTPNCHSNRGFFRKAAELSGGKDVVCEEKQCRRRGDAHCEYFIVWRA